MKNSLKLVRQATIVALGGFLMGFDISVIAGVIGPLREVFALSDLALGWSVASLTLSATIAMLLAGPLSDRYGRLPVLRAASLLFAISAVGSALAPDFASFVIARLIGGFAVGAALIVAPIYIGESAPPERRGMLVSINQLNIVIGISVAFFSNYFLAQLAISDLPIVQSLGIDQNTWRWMLGVESLPACIYFLGLYAVRESPRWLALRGDVDQAREALEATRGVDAADSELNEILAGSPSSTASPLEALAELIQPELRPVLGLCLMVAVLQQLTGINAVFFYAPMVFEQVGIGENAALWQAALVGLVNLALTIVAMAAIDRLGRRPLLLVGLTGMALSLFALASAFDNASYQVTAAVLELLPGETARSLAQPLLQQEFASAQAMSTAITVQTQDPMTPAVAGDLARVAIRINTGLVLGGILCFVGSFAVSLGPVMWVLLSELVPTRLRGMGVSIAGVANSAVSFLVQLLFPWELATIGAAATFTIFGVVAALGLIMIWRWMPETRGQSLEDLEELLPQMRSALRGGGPG